MQSLLSAVDIPANNFYFFVCGGSEGAGQN